VILAEELALLALDEDGEVTVAGTAWTAVATAVTGALIAGLQSDGHLRLDRDLTIRLTGSRPTHPALAAELDHLVPLDGRRLGTCFAGTAHAGWAEVVDTLVASGALREEPRPLRQPLHPPTEPQVHADLVARVRSAAMGREEPDEQMTALLAFVGAAGLWSVAAVVPAVAPGVKRRVHAALDATPLAELTRDAATANARRPRNY
jgi:hypothetical protein